MIQRKIRRSSQERSDLFDGLPDDILLSILCKLSSTARCPSDFISILLTYVFHVYIAVHMYVPMCMYMCVFDCMRQLLGFFFF